MALHPSGSAREDVELVFIETEQFTLIIKGKPYHEKYEGLRQYRLMDSHEEMQFSAKGEGVLSVKVFDIEQQDLVTPSTQRPIFFENGIYQLVLSPKEDNEFTFYHEHPLLRKAIHRVELVNCYILMGNLKFQNEIGLSTFEIREKNGPVLEVMIEVFTSKLDYKEDYNNLLQEVNDEIYNLAFHFIKKTFLGATLTKQANPSRSEFYRLLTFYFDALVKAVQRIERQPHHQLMTTHVKVRGDQLGRIDHQGRKYLRKKAHLFHEVENGIMINERSFMPETGLRIKKEHSYNTLENRFVKWMLERITHKMEDLLLKIQSRRKFEVTPDPVLLEEIKAMKAKVSGYCENPFWRQIGKLDRSLMSLVIQLAPGYRELYQIYLILCNGLSLQGNLYQMSVKDVATLYEYWTYLKLGQILGKKYRLLSQDIVKVSSEGLFVNLDSNKSAKRVYQHPITDERITLTYQKKDNDLPTIPQQPDTTLMIEKKGKNYQYHYIFDAKYKIDFALEGSYYHGRYKQPGPMEEDINTMHRYRDSLVVKQIGIDGGHYERKAFGAYVLFPGNDEVNYMEHHFYQSIDEVNIGGLPFLPNATDLVEQFVTRLIDKSPEEIQQEGILPQGTLQEWNSNLEEKVLVGMVPRVENLKAHIQHCFYHIPVRRLKKGWQEAKYIALYPKQGAGPRNGVICYGKVSDMKIVKRYDIKELPSNKEENYVRFNVEAWVNLKDIIKPVGYGIAVYIMSTLQMLKQSKELPELFMKSSEEVSLWRMLRRVSNKVSFELDARYLDQASKIERYRFKDIVVVMDYENKQIVMSRNSKQIIMELDSLTRHPSTVYKQLIELLEFKTD
jgi:predicted component of viral defense system (DUF524 family)